MTARTKKPTATVRAPSPAAPAAVDPSAADAFIRGTPLDVSGRPGVASATARPRAPQGSKVLLERKSGDVRRRMTVYLREDTAERLKAWCESRRTPASGVIDDAINAWFDFVRP